MQGLFLVIGAILGGWLGATSGAFLGLVVGAALGYALADIARARGAIASLYGELESLRRQIRELGRGAADAGQTVPAEFVSEPEPPRHEPKPITSPDPWEPEPEPPRPAEDRWNTPPEFPLDDVIRQSAIGRAIRDYFMGGNTIVRVGVIVLFFGVAFLLRYVAERTHVPIEFRLTGVALGALGLLGLGWRLRLKRPGFALSIQGGAVGILYLTVFAALRLYGLMAAPAAFALFVFIVAFSAALAVLQDSLSLVALGVVGGFLAPILASTGGGSHVVLFSYYTVLNLGILGIAWFKAWRPLNLLGFLFTFVIASAWGVLRYRPDMLWSTEPFLVAFFLLYTAIAVLYAFRQAPDLRNYVDPTIIFGTPLVSFGLQAAMLRDRRYAMAVSAVAVGGFYVALARTLFSVRPDAMRLLVESFLALGVGFLTLAVPLALDGYWSAATWALEGAALVWVGCRTGRLLPRAAGTLLVLAAGLIWFVNIDHGTGAWPLLNTRWLGGVMVSVAAVFVSGCLERNQKRLFDDEQPVSHLIFWWGVLWWAVAGLREIDRAVAADYRIAVSLAFAASTAVISSEIHRRATVSQARFPPLLLLPAMALAAVFSFGQLAHPFAAGGYAAWPVALAILYFGCRRHEGALDASLGNTLHVLALWLLAAILTKECVYAVSEYVGGGTSWKVASWVVVPSAMALTLPALAERVSWPIAAHRNAYLIAASSGFAAYGVLWLVMSSATANGDSAPLIYMPLLNPLDLAAALTLLAIARVAMNARQAALNLWSADGTWLALAALGFVWLNAVLLRTLHQWAGEPFELESMLRSTLVQTCLSIFWAVLSLSTMAVATRRGARAAWLAGASLLGVVVVKLFLIDLSRVGTVERIVSFVGVGLLMLVVGYVSPVPPASGGREAGQGDAG